MCGLDYSALIQPRSLFYKQYKFLVTELTHTSHLVNLQIKLKNKLKIKTFIAVDHAAALDVLPLVHVQQVQTGKKSHSGLE